MGFVLKGSPIRNLRTCVHIVNSAHHECAGVARIVMDLAKRSEAMGYRVWVLFMEDGPLVASMAQAGIPAKAIFWTGAPDDPAGAMRIWRWLRRQPADIAHLHHGGRLVRAVCRLAGISTLVQHVHGRVAEPSGAMAPRAKLRGVDAAIACSQAVAGCVEGCPTEVIYSGIELSPLPCAIPATRRPLRVGVLSRLIPVKNIESLIEATARLISMKVPIEVEIAGTGTSESALRALVRDLGVAEQVHFLGWRTDIRNLLESWDVLAMPSFDEGFPISALEAMAAARPVVASRVGGLNELVIDGVTGILLPPGDTDALVRCLAGLANDRERLTRMGNEGRNRAEAYFSVDVMARRTVELYDRLLQRGR